MYLTVCVLIRYQLFIISNPSLNLYSTVFYLCVAKDNGKNQSNPQKEQICNTHSENWISLERCYL